MKRIAVAALLASVAFAEVPYASTSGDITLTVVSWSTSSVPTAVSNWRPVTISGTWITACTANATQAKLKAIITYKLGSEVATLVSDFGVLNGAGNGLRCGNILPLITREAIISVSVVTASSDFNMADAN